jgi:hypothetical protein
MALHWLTYQQDGSRAVMIVEAPDLVQARMKAGLWLRGIDECFREGFTLPSGTNVPRSKLRRLLRAKEAARILESFA